MAVDYQPIYLLASGMLLQERKLGVTTNNLANIDTTAFKRDLIAAQSWYADSGNLDPSPSSQTPSRNFVYPIVGELVTDLSQGSLRHTGNPFDLAIEGEGFFAVRTPEGIAFTRRGDFRFDVDGYLVDPNGFRLLDNGMNEILLDFGETVIDAEGNIYVDGILQATIGVWNLDQPLKEGKDLYTGTPSPATNYKIRQGFLEMSNVNGVQEMVRLIELTRAHEIYSRLVRAMDEVQEKVNTLAR
jgi:flagellar basal-body rod protein FlgG